MPFPSIRGNQIMPSAFDKDTLAPDRHLPDRRRYLPPPLSTIRGNAGGDAKATCAESRLALRAEPRPPPDSAACPFRLRRMVLILQAIQLCLLRQMRFANSARHAKRY